MSEISVINGYKIKDKKAKRYYDNVESIKNDKNLKSGMLVETKGYFESNDGGSAEYYITNSEKDIPDDKKIILLNNGLKAVFLNSDYIKPEQFGAKGDNENDDTEIIQYCIDNFNNILLKNNYKITTIIMNRPNITINATGYIYGNINITKESINFNFNRLYGELKIIGDDSLITLLDIKGKRIINESGNGLTLDSNGQGIQYNKFSIGLIRAKENIKMDATGGGWINNNYFDKTNVSLGTGIVTVDTGDGTDPYHSNYFNQFGFEDIKKWFNLNRCNFSKFINCRMYPFEADKQDDSLIRVLGTINYSIIYFDCQDGTYFEDLELTHSTIDLKVGKLSSGVSMGEMKIINGEITYLNNDHKKYYKKISEMSSPEVINTDQYNYEKGITIIADVKKYVYFNIQSSHTNLLNYYKYIDVTIIGKLQSNIDITVNNDSSKLITVNAEDGDRTIRISLI